MTKKAFIISIGLIAAVFALKSTTLPSLPPASLTPTPPGSANQVQTGITMVIDYGNGEKSTHIRQYSPGQSAFSMLKSITDEKQIPLEYKEYSFGTLVESINGLKNSPSRAWIYIVNSKSPDMGAGQYQVQPGDVIEWQYITPE